ncbi:MAG: class I SAM-dependent methyltransferase [Pseudomonadota bacterium]
MPENPVDKDTEKTWGRVLERNRLKYPNESVVRWLTAVRGHYGQSARALEMGFGSGQHLQLLLDHDLRVDGTEFLETAIELGEKILRAHPLGGEIVRGDLDHPTIEAQSYDLFLAWGVLCLQTRSEMRRTLTRIHRILRPGGRACMDFRTPHNWFCGLGREVPSPGSRYWELDERAEEYCGFHYSFLDLEELQELFADSPLEIEVTERLDWWKGGMDKRHSWWIVRCIKK